MGDGRRREEKSAARRSCKRPGPTRARASDTLRRASSQPHAVQKWLTSSAPLRTRSSQYVRRRSLFTSLFVGDAISLRAPMGPTEAPVAPGGVGRFLLHAAARVGDIDALGKRIAAGDDVNEKDKVKRTPLHLAAWAGQVRDARPRSGAHRRVAPPPFPSPSRPSRSSPPLSRSPPSLSSSPLSRSARRFRCWSPPARRSRQRRRTA